MEGFSIPSYTLSQDADRVYIDITAANASTTPNIAVEGRIFGFHLEPYYLPLVLPHPVTRPDSDSETLQSTPLDAASNSSSPGEVQRFRVTLYKTQRGEQWSGLEQLQPQLLPEEQLKQALADVEQSKGFFQPAPTTSADGSDEAAQALLQQALRRQGLTTVNDDDGEAQIDASSTKAGGVKSNRKGPSYGFGFQSKFSGFLIPAGCADPRNVLEVPDPDVVEPAAREQTALTAEEERWDEGIYMDNFLDVDGELTHLLRFKPTLPSAAPTPNTTSPDSTLDLETSGLLLQLLFALSYDERTNDGDPTVESGWTLAKLSRSLSASTLPQVSSSLEELVASTLVGCVRRALTMPLYRHWELSIACIHDTLLRLEAGKTHVGYCLDEVASRLEAGEDAILCRLCEVWIKPLIAQRPSDAQLQSLSRAIREVMQQGAVVTKENVGGEEWDLEVLERAAQQALEDGEGGFV